MRRSVRCLWLCVILLCVGRIAVCEGELSVLLESSVTEFLRASETSVTVKLENLALEPVEDITITDGTGQVRVEAGTLTPGESVEFALTVPVTEEMLDAGILRIDTAYTTDGTEQTAGAELALTRGEPEIGAELLRRVSSATGSEEYGVTIVYLVRNTGTAVLTDLRMKDDGYDVKAERLEPGQSRAFVNHVALKKAYESTPTLRFVGEESGEKHQIELTELTIPTAAGVLDMEFSATQSLFAVDTAEVLLTLSNSGTAGYSDITVYDEIYGSIIAANVELPVGSEAVEIAMNYPIRGDGMYCWRVTGMCDTGEPIDLVTETLSLVDSITGGEVRLTASADTVMPVICRAGIVPVTFELDNLGVDMARQVTIREETRGVIRTLPVVPTGDATICTVRMHVEETETMHFYVDYEDANGIRYTEDAGEIRVQIAKNGVEPETDSNNLLATHNVRTTSDRAIRWALIGGFGLLTLLITSLLLMSLHTGAKRIVGHVRKKQKTGMHRNRRRNNATADMEMTDAEKEKRKHV